MPGVDEKCYDVFNALDQGFCTIRLQFQADGAAADYQFLQVNDAFEHQTGLRGATGRHMRELAPAHEEHWFRIYGEVARTGHAARFEQEAAALNRWFEVYAFRVGEPQLHHVGVLFRDITERRRADLALRAAREDAELANREKDEFLAMLAHELRTPIAPMLTALQLLRLRGAHMREHDILERQVEHLNRMVDDLLDVSRISRGKIELRRQRTELSQVIVEAIELAGPRLEQHFVDVQVLREGIEVDVDPARMAQVFANLLANAAKYSDAGSRILVSANREPAGVRVTIKDQGIGLAPDTYERIFEPFVQQPEGRERAAGGLGLGLAIVRNLVAAHGGTVRAESGGAGQGSAFIVELPADHGRP